MPLVLVTPPAVEPVSLLEVKNWVRADSDLTQDDALLNGLITAARQYAEMVTQRSLIAQGWRLVGDAFPMPQQAGVPFGQFFSYPSNALLLERGTVLSVTSLQYMDMNSVWQSMAANTYVAELSDCPARVAPAFGQVWPPTLPQIGSVKVDYLAGYASGCTFNATNDTVTPTLWPTLQVGDAIDLSISGDATSTLPAPLVPGRYYVQSIPVAGSYKLAATPSGAAIDITGTLSTGAIAYVGTVPQGIRNWLQVRVSTLYANREEVAILPRGKLEPLPYVDLLLDPFRVVQA